MRKHVRFVAGILCLCMLAGIMGACTQSQDTNAPSSSQPPAVSVSESQVSSGESESSVSIAAEAGGSTEPLPVAAEGSTAVQAILDSYSTKQFAAGEVSDDDLRQILQSGAKAPSARNLQPWHFTVVTGSKVTEMINQAADGNVLIIISGADDTGDGMNVDYDCGLASAYLYLAAQSLGYGAHIYMGGVSNINDSRRDELQIPDGYSAVMMLLIGNVPDAVDAVSSASQRNPLEDMVTYVE